jgi:putative cardiolipin synthase
MHRVIQSGLLVAAILLFGGCASAPLDYPRDTTYAAQDTSDTRQAKNANRWLEGKTDVNGFYPLNEGFDAFGARLILIDNAEVSVDMQYFLMKSDNAGYVMASKLLDAADRGVRVRLLLDDIFTTVDDEQLAVLDAHPNLEVRIFNPISRKGIFAFNYLGNFSLANRRMHNKALISDNQVAVVGGRNLGVEYYQLEETGEFMDFDMLSVGPIVREVSETFDIYWNHELAVPLEALFAQEDEQRVAERRAALQRLMEQAGDSIYAEAINTEVLNKLQDRILSPYIAEARLIVDDPQKLLEEVSDEHKIVANEVREALLNAQTEVIISTPYFIPRERGLQLLRETRDRGVRVVIFTNSLSTNNHTAVHSAYSSYRRDLLEMGVELWEARADAIKVESEDGQLLPGKLTLHTKGMAFDRRKLFVGSLNLDPRSIDINTEMGLLIDSPELTDSLAQGFLGRLPDIAWQLQLDPEGDLNWHATIDGEEVVETTEPQTTGWERFSAWFQKIAPESQL